MNELLLNKEVTELNTCIAVAKYLPLKKLATVAVAL
jgi:hypothetical protein